MDKNGNIVRVPSNVARLGYSESAIAKMVEKENAALAMCGALLGDCYILMEIADNLLTDMMPMFKKKTWCKNEVKQALNNAHKELKRTITASITNSVSDPQYMRNVADAAYELIKDDLFKLKNSLSFELNKRFVKHADDIRDLAVIDVLFACIQYKYDSSVRQMKTVYDAFYDSWYGSARCDGPSFWWSKAMQTYSKRYMSETIDLNAMPMVQSGIKVIMNKLDSASFTDTITSMALEEGATDDSQRIMDKSMAVLGLKQV